MSDEAVRRAELVRVLRTLSNDGVQVGGFERAARRGDGGGGAGAPAGAAGAAAAAQLGKFVLTGLSACAAEGATFPVDCIKTRMQLHTGRGEAAGGFAATLRGVLANEGVAGLYMGVGPAIARHVPYSGIRVGLYSQLREVLVTDGQAPSFLAKLALGFCSGGVAQTVAVPMDLIKVRLIADSRLPAPERRYRGLWHALHAIPAAEGVAGLWRGSKPAIVRAAMVNLGELASYDTAKRAILDTGLVPDNIVCHVLSAMVSGFFASLVSTPADVVKTRLMNDSARYGNSMLRCTLDTVRAEGVRAMWKGFLPAWARLGPWQLTFW
jgi:solute carrier family 25 uncoupling protein 27